jgi:hypothetical protein
VRRAPGFPCALRFFEGDLKQQLGRSSAAASRNCAAEEPLTVVNGYGLRRNDDRVA